MSEKLYVMVWKKGKKDKFKYVEKIVLIDSDFKIEFILGFFTAFKKGAVVSFPDRTFVSVDNRTGEVMTYKRDKDIYGESRFRQFIEKDKPTIERCASIEFKDPGSGKLILLDFRGYLPTALMSREGFMMAGAEFPNYDIATSAQLEHLL